VFGEDPFSLERQKACVERHSAEPHPDTCYNHTVNGDFLCFKQPLLDLINTTRRYNMNNKITEKAETLTNFFGV